MSADNKAQLICGFHLCDFAQYGLRIFHCVFQSNCNVMQSNVGTSFEQVYMYSWQCGKG